MRVIVSSGRLPVPAEKVWAEFDEKLFRSLLPPFPKIKIDRFDGCRTGDRIHLRVAGSSWIGLITEQSENAEEIWFVDKGLLLPAPLHYWQHTHRIRKHGKESEIVDEIVYSSGSALLDALLYFPLWLQFRYRRPIYRRIFR